METTQKRTAPNIIADEIVANLKMIGIGLVICAIYLAGFWIYHIPDRKPVSDVEFGQSCYDDCYNPSNYWLISDEGANEMRIEQAKYDFEKQLSYSIFFLPLFLIVVRYIIMLAKWVIRNRTTS